MEALCKQRTESRTVRIMWLMVWMSLFRATGSTSCTFDESYRGRWYQRGLGEVTIHNDTITSKGKCMEQHKDKFFLRDEEQGCKRCLLIIHRHRNILQYKESYCFNPATLQEACFSIQMEAALHTLVRDDPIPIPCPLQVDYTFKYNNGSRDYCNEPRSEVRTCASHSKLRFRFRHCEDVPDTFEQDLELRCLATWKDGSAMYLYGNFRGDGVANHERNYRCFMYKIFSTEVHMSMSANSDCWGLTSPTDGEVVLELTQDPNESSLKTVCKFPEWMIGKRWRDLSGRHTYQLSGDNSTLRKNRQRDGHVAVAFRCAHALSENADDDSTTTIVTRVTKGCSTHYQCLRIARLRDNILQLSLGASAASEDINCVTSYNANSSSIHTLYDGDSEGTRCPMPGKFISTTAVSSCVTKLLVGCNSTSVLTIDDSCDNRPEGAMECLYHWTSSSGQTMLLGRKPGDDSNITNCFAMSRSGSLLSFHTDSQCNTHVDHIFKDAIKLELEAQPGLCGGCSSRSSRLTSLFLLAIPFLLHVVHRS